jgi:hypothetical protein
MEERRFINDVIKPWEDLNDLLCQNYAVQSDLSEITRLACALAVSIRHQVDFFLPFQNKKVSPFCFAHQLITDLADFSKHGSLHNTGRNCTITSSSAFEFCEDKGFRFIRNIVRLNHNTFGEYDFMKISAQAIGFWIKQKQISHNWIGISKESLHSFEPIARLIFNPNFCYSMNSTAFHFLQKNPNGEYVPVEPSWGGLEIY